MDKQPDELILQSLRQGSYDAFDALYMRYAPHVEAFAFCMLKNRSEAEDLAHDIFLKIWETRESIGRIKSFRSYLFRMTKNAVFDIFEHKSVQTRYEQRLLHVEDLLTDDISTKVATEDLLMIIDMAVEQMPEQRQRVFRLSRYEGLSHQQIAQKLGVTPKTVEYHIRTALAELKKNHRRHRLLLLILPPHASRQTKTTRKLLSFFICKKIQIPTRDAPLFPVILLQTHRKNGHDKKR
ncbi:MAG: RNA polymerase sigma-70 factor [Alistipes finegoldii]|uniref:RNA polymerase sigma-70 factor n=1 Tax=Alistipes finegoldii TaxID=214856 RepID=UPI0039A2B29E